MPDPNAQVNPGEVVQATPMTPGDQIAGAWNAMLGMMTAQGATREDIIQMSLYTGRQIVALTATALWPSVELDKEHPSGYMTRPDGTYVYAPTAAEADAFLAYDGVLGEFEDAIESVTPAESA